MTATPGWRRLLWLTDPTVAAAWPQGRRRWWCGADAPAGWTTVAPRQARRQLGGECDLLVFDARAGFDADAFGALSGAVVGGGALLLLTPPPGDWPAGRFAARWLRLLLATGERPPATASPVAAPPAEGSDPAALTADQARAVAAVLRVARGHRRRPLVLTADRGRGKSAALGIAAARLLQQGATRVLVTAPRSAAAASLFGQVERLLGTRHPAGLAFVAPDALLRQPQPAELLLVDEAAALPVPLLEGLLRRHARIAFATTVHGYEGTGRGFAVRFRQVLDTLTPGWRELRLQAPVRWAPDDPLEAFSFAALLLDAAPAEATAVAGATPASCRFGALDRDALAADEPLLRELFGLLVLAHYQTRPSDLQRLLDDPAVTVWAARHASHLVAAAVVVQEGGLTPVLAQEVAAGRRRPAGHLLPQALALHEGCTAALPLRYARVMRIAVHPAAQRRGLGQTLLATLARESPRVDFLGTSFGATSELLRFWQGAGLLPVRVGVQRDAASGTHSVLLLRPLGAPAAQLFEALRARFLEQLPYRLADGLDDLEPALLAALARGAPAPLPLPQEQADLAAYASGRRDYAGVLAALWRGAWHALANDGAAALSAAERDALVRRVLQKRPWAEVAALQGVPGRSQIEAQLRAGAAALLRRWQGGAGV